MARRPVTERVPVAMRDETRSDAWMRNFRLSGFAFAILGLMVAALVVLAPSLKTLVEQHNQIVALQQQLDATKSKVASLHEQVDEWKQPAYIEAQARGRLFYVFPGDVDYLVTGVDSGTGSADGQPVSDKIQTTKSNWVSSLVGSLYTSGLTDKSPDQLTSSQPMPTSGG